MRRLAVVAVCCAIASASPRSARAWDLETHVGLTHRAALGAALDAWLRTRGLSAGLYEALALSPQDGTPPDFLSLDDRALVEALGAIDAALGVRPDKNRQPALAWLLAGAALEGAREDRLRNHDLRPLDGPRAKSAGQPADRWVESVDNALSRGRLLDALERAASGETDAARQAALARALVCAGSIAYVLEAVGDPAHARGDSSDNLAAGAPLATLAKARYGRSVPGPTGTETPAMPTALSRFFVTPEHTGLGDQVARAFVSPGTLPDGPMPLPWPQLQPGPEPRGLLSGPMVHVLAAYQRDATGLHYTIPPVALAEAADVLLPLIVGKTTQLIDFLFRGELEVRGGAHEARFVVGGLGLGRGHISVLDEDEQGRRTPHFNAETAGGPPGTFLHAFSGHGRPILVYRGVDANGEPIVLTAAAPR